MKRSAGGSAKKDKASSTGNMEGGSDSDGNEKDDDTQRKEAGDDDDKSIATTTRRRNPDAGHTQILKFGESIPGIHPLGKYPPRWIAKRDKTGEVFRGIQFIDRLNLLFEKIPGMLCDMPSSGLCLVGNLLFGDYRSAQAQSDCGYAGSWSTSTLIEGMFTVRCLYLFQRPLCKSLDSIWI